MEAYFDGSKAAVTGVIAACVGMAIASVIGALTGLEDLWVWGFTLGFGGGMLVYAAITWILARREEDPS
ncbi:MAG: hypothetical protein GYB64_07880 [Chloroflexi bacterium]|nr:hypothetical protein [Chloroflexota bacterium]